MAGNVDGCLQRPGRQKTAGITLYLMEELGDARLRCDQLVRYLDEAVKLIEKSNHKDHFFEVAGHLIHSVPEAAFKLQKSLQAVALAADRLDYEELKQELRPEKVDELERVLKEVRIRHVQHRSDPGALPMTPKQAAQRLRDLAKIAREEGSLPLYEVAAFVHELHPARKANGSSAGDMLDRIANELEKPEGEVSRMQLATLLSRIAMESEFETALHLASKPRLTQEVMQLGNVEEVKKKFKAENPDISDEDLNEIAKQWQENKDVVKDKSAAEEDPAIVASFDHVREMALVAFRGANAGRWRPAMLALREIVDDIGTILVRLGSIDAPLKTEALKREIRQVIPGVDKALEEAPVVTAAEADVSKLYHEMSAHLDTFDMAWSRYEKDPEKNKAKLDDALRYMKAIQNLAGILVRNMEKKLSTKEASEGSDLWKASSAAEDARRSRFEEGKPADPTENMSPEDAKEWKAEHQKNKDNFKAADEKRTKFEEGKPADPTENMSPEDAKQWREEHQKNKDNFKAASDEAWKA